ncbi:hypothetical protein [Microbacterium timonense]|uniref:hypothetical protein n=1 Tax=Microbacterium timonense TaxID=2086576 RepID=UPI0011B23254|nr:hypothetical protein [Microbacterium timonense]
MTTPDGPSRRRTRVTRYLAYGAPIAMFIVSVVGLFTDVVALSVRLILLGVVFVLLAASGIATYLTRRSLREQVQRASSLAAKLNEARELIAGSSPERILDALGQVLFRGGSAWRLGVYAIEYDSDGVGWMNRLMRRSGSELYEQAGRLRIRLDRSVLRDLKNIDLTNPAVPHVNQTGSFSSREFNPDEWHDQQLDFLKDPEEVDRLRMPSRKYAWCATRDRASRETFALIAEVIEPDGLNYELLDSPLVAPWLEMIARAVELPVATLSTVHEAAQHIESREGL